MQLGIIPNVGNPQPYTDVGSDYYEARYNERVFRNITRMAWELGYELTLQPLAERIA